VNAISPVDKGDNCWPVAVTAARAAAGVSLPELRELRSFAIAARTGNLGQAARHLNVTAAAVSQQLRRLEETLGAQLLIRHSRGVSTTPAGRVLLRRADTILRVLETPLVPMMPPAAAQETVSIALPAEFGPLLAAPLLAAARHRCPGATIAFHESAGDAVEAVCDGQVDVALVEDPPKLDDLLTERLLTEDLGVVFAPDHKLATSMQPVRLRDLLTAPLILPNRRHWIRRLLAKAEAQRSLRFDTVTSVDGVPMILAMVRHGVGGTILPAATVKDDIARGTLAFRTVIQPALSVAHAVAARRDASPTGQAFMTMAAEVIRAVAGSGLWPGSRLLRGVAPAAFPEHGGDSLPAPVRMAVLAAAAASPACVEGH
jgi:LysR family transcriptional regulator, nitrogen assimilation regulatory protein